MTKLQSISLYLIVFTCGAVIMVFELAGSRLLAPFLGTSIYVWSCLIGVILGSLSLGYWLGGRLADKRKYVADLSFILLMAAAAIAFTAILNRDILKYFDFYRFGPYFSILYSSLILFAPAGFFLGMISPYAAKLKLDQIDTAGATIGNLYTLSTVGSISGTFAAGFYLIPSFGTIKILYFIVIALLVSAIIICPKKNKLLLIIGLLSLAVWASLFPKITHSASADSDLIADIDTPYNRIRILKGTDPKMKAGITMLSTDPFGIQAAIYDNSDELIFGYTKYFRLGSHFRPTAKNALMIGGCAYTFPRDYLAKNPNAMIDVVEIDPGMTEAAKKYFRLKDDPRMRIIHEDGRIFLNRANDKYDLIFVDAFNSASAVPYQLTTREAAAEMHRLLEKDGVVLINILSALEGEKGLFYEAIYQTLKSIFPQIQTFAVDDPNEKYEIQNIVIAAFKSADKPDFISNNPELAAYLRNRLPDNYFPKPSMVLTDNYAPVEYYKQLSLK